MELEVVEVIIEMQRRQNSKARNYGTGGY